MFLLLLILAAANGAFDADRFAAATTDGGFMMVEAPSPSLPASFMLAARTGILDRPLELVQGMQKIDAITVRSTLSLMGSYVPVRRLEVGVALPIIMQQSGEMGAEGAGVGDLRFVPKLTLFDREIGVALLVPITLPSGDASKFEGAGDPTFVPTVAVQAQSPRLRATLDAGVRLRSDKIALGTPVGNELALGLAVGVRVTSPIELMAEALLASRLADPFQKLTTPVEALGGVRWEHGPWAVLVGAGGGIVQGYGSPLVRGLVQIGYAPRAAIVEPVVQQEIVQAPPPPPSPAAPPPPPPPPPAAAPPNPTPEEQHEQAPLVVVTPKELQTLQPIFFDTNYKRVRHRFYSLLEQVAHTLKTWPAIKKVRIEGHADATGPHDFNDRLSKARAEAVVAWLVAHGVEPERLDAIGFAEGKPWVTNETEIGRAKNRRVMFHIAEWAEGAQQPPEPPEPNPNAVRP